MEWNDTAAPATTIHQASHRAVSSTGRKIQGNVLHSAAQKEIVVMKFSIFILLAEDDDDGFFSMSEQILLLLCHTIRSLNSDL